MNIEEILEMWEKDSQIDDLNLDKESTKTPQLHAKYLELLNIAKMKLKKKELQQKVILKEKWLYYTGKMSKDEMDERGWPYDPFDGLKIMKSDMSYYYNSDKDLQKFEELIEYHKMLVQTLTEILDNLRWRQQTIKNIISWKQFTAGV